MSQPRIAEAEEVEYEISLEDSIKHKLPGYTVNLLLEQGDVASAKAELERLVLEGIDSGDPIEITPQYFENLRRELHLREEARETRRSA